METDDRPFSPTYPLGFLARTTAFTALACVVGLVLLRWMFSRDLGTEYGVAFHTLKQLLSYLLPALVFCVLSVLLIASVAVFAVAVFASHKVAGPMFRLQRVAGHLGDLLLVGHIHLRVGDQGKPVAQVMNDWGAKRKNEVRALRYQVDRCTQALQSCKEVSVTDDRTALTERVELLVLELSKLKHN